MIISSGEETRPLEVRWARFLQLHNSLPEGAPIDYLPTIIEDEPSTAGVVADLAGESIPFQNVEVEKVIMHLDAALAARPDAVQAKRIAHLRDCFQHALFISRAGGVVGHA